MGHDLSPDDHDDAPIEAGASLEVWDRRTVLETFGETDLRVQGPKKVAEDGPTYISIHAGPEDDSYLECERCLYRPGQTNTSS